ncbi:MAG: glycosyltransferase family 4 protein [Bacteroidota bacterium]
MKIAITADPFIPVPPVFYGGIERIIDLLCKELSLRGHEVTLFAHRDSKTAGNLIAYRYESGSLWDTLINGWTVSRAAGWGKFDLIHNFGRLGYLLPLLPANIPKLMSYQREPTIAQIKKAVSLSRRNTLFFTGCSDYITNQIQPYAKAFTVYNGVDTEKYTACTNISEDAPLIFLGRIEPVKGTDAAINFAVRTNKRLIIAGNVPPDHQTYFEKKILPLLDSRIQYIGPVNDEQKQDLLANGLALLMLIKWNEPFGIVMAESMACGTPVLGLSCGAVPEVIDFGVTGYYSEEAGTLADYVSRVAQLDRSVVRKVAETRFSAKAIVNEYLKVYQYIINRK